MTEDQERYIGEHGRLFRFDAPKGLDTGEHEGAIFSDCRRHRFLLWRMWRHDLPYVLMVLLNPSTADEHKNDPTIAGQVARLDKWKARGVRYGGVVVANLFGYRATDWRVVRQAYRASDDVIGIPKNDEAIAKFASGAGLVLCGWGKHAEEIMPGRAAAVLALLRAVGPAPMAFRFNGDGSPAHPLYVPHDAVPVPFISPRAPLG